MWGQPPSAVHRAKPDIPERPQEKAAPTSLPCKKVHRKCGSLGLAGRLPRQKADILVA
jgi:hypothetical protein